MSLLDDPAWAAALNDLDPDPGPLARYHNDPVAFVTDCIDWTGLQGPTPYQTDALASLVDHNRVSVRGPHGLGKTAEKAWAIWWFSLTRDAAGEDWKIPTTASVWRQLKQYLWPEVHKWAKRIRWDVIDRDPVVEGRELLDMSLKLRHGEAFAVASSDPAKIEGAHADQVLYIFDEAKIVPADTFDAAEGAFSGAGDDTTNEAYALASSTPGPPNGRFYDIHRRAPGYEDWHVIAVTLDQVIAAGRVSRQWADQRRRQWGAKSAVYLNRVEGKFAASDEDSVIPLEWVELANERWTDLHPGCQIVDDRVMHTDGCEPGRGLDAVGVDVARSGKDRTVQALRYGPEIRELRRSPRQDTMATVGEIEGTLRGAGQGLPIVDVIGIGAGVVDRLRERGIPTVGFNASEGTQLLDRSGELGFTNKRSAAWWTVRELLDPASGVPVALPPDDLLTGDLTAPTWRVLSGGRIQVERKDDIRKRIGRSTDDGDAVVQAFWVEPDEVEEGIVEYYEPVHISRY